MEQVFQHGLVLGQGLVEDLLPGSIECAGVVGLFAHVQPHQISKPVFSLMPITILASKERSSITGDASAAGTHVTSDLTTAMSLSAVGWRHQAR
ncbi:hypothetical protein [Luteococcus japonicus]|uniref:hypothetical protein n=1 Tax=Luteococcus japonicus TaxID=33984 RepID=UPI00117D2F2D|nr:hypothetical protein [Luteococcus japonicus]